MPCDICGKDAPLVRAKIEGTFLDVCGSCSKFGEISPETKVLGKDAFSPPGGAVTFGKEPSRSFPHQSPRPAFRPARGSRHRARPVETETALVFDYGNIVRKAREARNLSQGDLAKKINEKESIIRQIEHEHIHPDGKTVKKLEKFLSVKLLTLIENVEVKTSSSSEATLGDIVKIRKR